MSIVTSVFGRFLLPTLAVFYFRVWPGIANKLNIYTALHIYYIIQKHRTDSQSNAGKNDHDRTVSKLDS